MEELFNKTITISIRKDDREERLQPVGVCVLVNVTNTPVHKKDLILRLTDETDPFFLYTLTISEEDYQVLKTHQGLLVDFSCFPQKLIDLLQTCLSESTKLSPKFSLQLHLSTGATPTAGATPSLQVVEINPFRHLNHISLKLVPASDSFLKKHLAQNILDMKQHNQALNERLHHTKSDLSAQLLHAEELLSTRSKELDRMKSDWTAEITAINNRHSATLNEEKEKAMTTQLNLQRQLDNVKKEQEELYHKRIGSLEGRMVELDTINKELTDHKYRCEAAIRELKAKLKGTEEELLGTREELTRARKETTSLGADAHQRELTTNQLHTRVAVLEQEIKDKTQILVRTNQLLEKANEQKAQCEGSLEQKTCQIIKLDTAFKQTSQEVAKGNEIIARLQSDIKTLKSKLKLRNSVTTQQEKIINDKDVELSKLTNELKFLNNDLVKKGEESVARGDTIERLQLELQKVKEELKTSENVVAWLNKQINDQAVTRSRLPLATSVTKSGATTTDHLSTIRGSYTMRPPQFSSTPTGGSGIITGPNTPTGPYEGGASDRPHPFNSNQKILFKGGVATRASPLSTHTISSNQQTTPTYARQSPKEPFIDSKYLPPETTPITPSDIKENAPLLMNYLPK